MRKIVPLVVAGLVALVSSCNNNSGLQENPEKHTPKINSTPTLSVNEGESYNYPIDAKDEDGNALNYSLLSAPAWLSVDTNGKVSGTAPIIEADTIDSVSVKVSNGEYSATQEFNLRNKDLETRAAITGAADRLITLQHPVGSWDWWVTNKTGPTSNYFYNLAGVTGEGLLGAHVSTGEVRFLNAAKKAGDYIVSVPISTSQRQNSAAVTFLQHLSTITGDTKYDVKADAIMNHLLHETNSFSAGFDKDGTLGLSAQELLNAYIDYRQGFSNPNGIVPWDLFQFVEGAKTFGDNAFANDLANKIKGYSEQSGFTSSKDYYDLGLAATIMGLADGGLNYASQLNALIARQNSDGGFTTTAEGRIQTSSYVLGALKKVKNDRARNTLIFLKNNFGYNGINGWLDGVDSGDPNPFNGLTEYAESDSEAVAGLSSYIAE